MERQGFEFRDSAGFPDLCPDDSNRFVTVCLADIKKEMQCPICLGVIRNTRTVMECLHRFCRECIDKAMRLGNNECPACRVHCASRRSLRDDPKFDSLVAVLYPDVDKYEEEEVDFNEEEKARNRRIQSQIAVTLRRQSVATNATSTKAAMAAGASTHARTALPLPGGRRGVGGRKGSRHDEYSQQPSSSLRRHHGPLPFKQTHGTAAGWRGSHGRQQQQQQQENVRESRKSKPGWREEKLGGRGVGDRGRRTAGSSWLDDGGVEISPAAASLARALITEPLDCSDPQVHISVQPYPVHGSTKASISPPSSSNCLPLLALEQPFLICPSHLTVHQLGKFIQSQLEIETEAPMELLIPNRESSCSSSINFNIQNLQTSILEGYLTLEHVVLHLWEFTGNPVLLYRLQEQVGNEFPQQVL